MAVIELAQIGNPSFYLHPRGCLPCRRQLPAEATAIDVEVEVGVLAVHLGPDRCEEVIHRIAVGGMGVAAQKRHTRAALQRGGLIGPFNHPGAGCCWGLAEGFGFDHGPLDVAVAEGEIHLAHHIQFPLLHGLHGLQGPVAGVAVEGFSQGGAQLAEIVEIGVAEENFGLGGPFFDQGKTALGNRVAGDVNEVEFATAILHELAQRQHEGGMDHLNTLALELLGVTAEPGKVGGQQGDFVTELLDEVHFHQGRVAAGIPVGAGGVVVEEQGPADDAAILNQLRLGIGGFWGAIEPVGPFLFEQGAVDLLVFLEAFFKLWIGTIAESLVVDHPG